MPKGIPGSGVVIQRGIPCRRCGQDEWIPRRKSFECRPCNRRVSVAGRRRARAERPAILLFDLAKQRARATGLTFDLTVEDIEAVWPADGRCPALGITLQPGRGKMQDSSPTLDRLVDSWGYVKGNIQILSLKANRAKGNATAAELESLAAWMRSHGLS